MVCLAEMIVDYSPFQLTKAVLGDTITNTQYQTGAVLYNQAETRTQQPIFDVNVVMASILSTAQRVIPVIDPEKLIEFQTQIFAKGEKLGALVPASLNLP